MARAEIEQKCWQCKGDGVAELSGEYGDIVVDPCNICGGSGYSTVFYLDIDTIMKLIKKIEKDVNKIKAKLDIE